MREEGYEGIQFDKDFNITYNAYSGTTLGKNIVRMFEKAKQVQARQASAAASLDTEMANLGSTVMFDDKTWATMSEEQKVKALKDSLGTVESITKTVRDSDGITRFDKSQEVLNELEEHDTYVKAAEGDLDKLRTELFGAKAASSDVMGKGIQALVDSGWAESNGFELGRYIDSDGDGIPDNYVEGPDDRKAMLAWRRQLKRGTSRYGMRGGSTGMWVEMQVALSDDQVNEYRTTSGFAYVGETPEDGRWMSGAQIDAELERAVSSPVKLVEINGGEDYVVMNSSGDFFRYADSDGDGADDYFIEITDDERAALQAKVADGTYKTTYLRAGTEVDKDGNFVSGSLATDADIITEPGDPTKLTAEDFEDLWDISPDDPKIQAMLQARALSDMGVKFVDEATFKSLKSHRVVGRLKKQHAYDDLVRGVGTVRVETEYGEKAFTPDQIIGNPKVVSKKSNMTFRSVVDRAQGAYVADQLGYGTEGVPTEPKTFQRGGTVFEDEADVRDNAYDWLETQVGNLPESPGLAEIRDQLAMGTAEGIQEIEGSIDVTQSQLAAVEKNLSTFDAATERMIENLTEPEKSAVRRDRTEERDRLVGERNEIQNELAKLERQKARAERQFKRQATPEVEEEVATEIVGRDRARTQREREKSIASDAERYNALLKNFVEADDDGDGVPNGIKGLVNDDDLEFFLDYLVMEDSGEKARLVDKGLITEADLDKARDAAASRGMIKSRTEAAYADRYKIGALSDEIHEVGGLRDQLTDHMNNIETMKPQVEATLKAVQAKGRTEPVTAEEKEILAKYYKELDDLSKVRGEIKTRKDEIDRIELRPLGFLGPDEKPKYRVGIRTQQGLTQRKYTPPMELLDKTIRGTEPEAVSEVQDRLIALGITEGGTDDDFYTGLERALKDFQTKQGLTVTGTTTEETWRRLRELTPGIVVDRDGDGKEDEVETYTIVSIDGETKDRIRYDQSEDIYYVRTEDAKDKSLRDVSDVTGSDWKAIPWSITDADGEPRRTEASRKLESLLFDSGISREALNYRDVGKENRERFYDIMEAIGEGTADADDWRDLKSLIDPTKPDRPVDIETEEPIEVSKVDPSKGSTLKKKPTPTPTPTPVPTGPITVADDKPDEVEEIPKVADTVESHPFMVAKERQEQDAAKKAEIDFIRESLEDKRKRTAQATMEAIGLDALSATKPEPKPATTPEPPPSGEPSKPLTMRQKLLEKFKRRKAGSEVEVPSAKTPPLGETPVAEEEEE
tara:strand:- start:80 stop:3832 length:3753 start_codon:yes stop_codon:yes gene_type:complete